MPCDVEGLLEFFAARSLPGVEAVDPERLVYRRTIDLARLLPEATEADARLGVLQVDFGGPCRVEVEVRSDGDRTLAPRLEDEVGRRLRRLFDLDADPFDLGALRQSSVFAEEGWAVVGVRVPGAWDRFETAVRAVLGQQISVAGARTLAGRLVAELGPELPPALRSDGLERTFPSADRVARFDLRTIGLPASRARALGELASQVASGALRLDAHPQEVRRRLLAIKGIGPWTVEYVAMRALGDGDAFPASDLGLRKAIDRAEPPSAAELEAMAEAWRPLRAYAAILLWRRGGGG